MDSAVADGGYGQVGDGLALRARRREAPTTPATNLPTTALDNPSGCPQPLGQPSGLPTLPTGPTETSFFSFLPPFGGADINQPDISLVKMTGHLDVLTTPK